MLDAHESLLCSKLCRHNVDNSTNPNTRNGSRLRSPSPIMAPVISEVFKLVSTAANVFADIKECCDSVLYSVVGLCCL